jgi:putative ABC transport system permease protein
MASFIVVGSYVYSELSFDRYHVNRDDIYLIYSDAIRQEPYLRRKSGQVPYNFGRALEKEYPHIGKTVELLATSGTIGTEQIKRSWNDVFFCDPAILDMFTHEILYGNPKSAFDDPRSIAINESFARFYFGDVSPLGKTLTHNDVPLVVTLVFADQPHNVFYRYNALIPIALAKQVEPMYRNDDVQMNMSLPSVLLHLDRNVDIESAEAMINNFAGRQPGAEKLPVPESTTFHLKKLTDLRLFSADISTGWAKSSPVRFFGLIAIAFCITFVACINSINLGIARMFRQLNDISVQRLIGGKPWQIAIQSLVEILCLSMGALILALVLIEVCSHLSLSSQFSDAFTALNWRDNPDVYFALAGLGLLIGVSSGLYPVWKIVRLPIQSKHQTSTKRRWLSTALVSVQLLAATSAIVVTVFFMLQTTFIYSTDLGLNLDNRLLIKFGNKVSEQQILRVTEDIRQHPGVASVSKNLWSPGSQSFTFNSFLPGEDRSRNDPNNRYSIIAADDYFAETMELRFVMGGPPNHDVEDDKTNGVIISESILAILNMQSLPEQQVIGSTLDLSYDKETAYKPRILGVIKDFHSRSLRDPIMPVVVAPIEKLPLPEEWLSTFQAHLTINYSPDYQADILAQLKAITETHIPAHLVSYDFLDALWRRHYGDEDEALKQAQFFSVIAVALCLLGLSGLSAYAAQSRRKELGIRKVIGAATGDLLKLMGKQFFWITTLISIPAWIAAYLIVQAWLEPFAYRINLTLWPFLLASGVVIMLSQATILAQSWKTARSNPVESLRYE